MQRPITTPSRMLSEQGRRPVALVVVGHGALARDDWQARLGTAEHLNPGLPVNRSERRLSRRGGVLSRSNHSTPCVAGRACRRQTAGRLALVRRATTCTVKCADEAGTILGRWTCFSARFRSATIDPNRTTSSGFTSTHTIGDMPPQSHTAT